MICTEVLPLPLRQSQAKQRLLLKLFEMQFLLVINLLSEPTLLVHSLNASPVRAKVLINCSRKVPVVVNMLHLFHNHRV